MEKKTVLMDPMSFQITAGKKKKMRQSDVRKKINTKFNSFYETFSDLISIVADPVISASMSIEFATVALIVTTHPTKKKVYA